MLENYGANFNILFSTFSVLILLLLLLFRKSITSVFDPLVPFCAWGASVLAVAMYLFAIKPDLSFFFYFVFSTLLAVLSLAWLLSRDTKKNKEYHASKNISKKHITKFDWIMFWVLVVINSLSLSMIIVSALRFGVSSLFAIKFFLAEDFKSPLLKIITIVIRPMFFAQAFRIYYLIHSKSKKYIVLTTIILFAVVIFLVGNRSVILMLGLLYGGTLVLYQREREAPLWSKSYFIFMILVASLIITLTIATAGFFNLDFASALPLVMERIVLAADGLFMWVKGDMQSLIHQSPLELLNFIFGQFLGTLNKNFGLQLYEAFIGKAANATYGPNFIFPFQLYLAGWASPFWLMLIVAAAFFMRRIKPAHNVTDCCRIVLVASAFLPFQDPEYAAFLFGFLFVFWLLISIVRSVLITASSERICRTDNLLSRYTCE